MSTEVDSRIVEMKFDSKDFEKNAQSTLSVLDKLKEKLNFSDTKESFNSFDTSKLRKELDKVNEFDTGKLESVFDKLEYRMSNMGIFTARIVENIADDIYNMVKKAMDNIGKIVDFAEQGIVQGGYTRASNIQSAKFQLEGLGIKWSEIYGDIDYAVTNTAYSLDQAAIVASQLASSGIKPGTTWKDLSGKEQDIDYMAMILRSISGTASATGGKADYADIGRIFTKMLSYGKVYTQNLNELATYGIGAKGIVAEYLNQIKYKGSSNWTEKSVQDTMSDRKGGGLDPQIVMEAFFNKFADHATAANETLTGVTANLRAALARIGEKFFEPIIQNGGPLVKFLDALRKSINDLNKVLGPVTESLGRYVANNIEKIHDLLFNETTVKKDDKGNIVYKTDANGEVLKDENGKPIPETTRTFKLGGIFSDFMKPWKEAEWLPTNIGENERRQGLNLPTEYLQEYETRAQKIAGNLLAIVKNIGRIITGVGKLFASAFKGATDGGFSLAAVLVTVTNFLEKLTRTIANFINAPEFVNSGIYLFFRFLADSVRIMISFAKSFKKHIIDPIFSAGKAAASASGIGSWFRDLFDRIHNFSLKLREEGNEDYFGPFLEKIKAGAKAIKEKLGEMFGNIGSIVKNGMRDLIDWWKPIKDIIFDTDLGFKDKLAAIKDYFSENFELPGWSKVKSIFGGIGDAIGKAYDAIKKFFGFGKKKEGIPDPDEYELVASKGDFSGIFGIQSELEQADKSTEKLTTIGDRLSNFFSKVGEAFSNLNLGGIKGVTFGLLAIIILLAVGIALAVKKVLDSMKKLVIDFPAMAEKILKSFQGVLDEIAGMFKAQKYEIYTQALKNIAVATAMLTAVFIGLAGILAVVDHFGGGDEMADALKQAGAVIASIAGGLTVMLVAIIAVTNLTSGKSVYGLNISKKGLSASAPSMSLAAVASIISSFVKGIAILAGVVVVLGALSYIPGLLDRGFSALLEIVLILGASIVIFTLLVGAMSGLSASIGGGTGATAFAGSMAAIAGILTALTVGILIITPVIAILGIMSFIGLFNKGLNALISITVWMTVTVGILMGITAVVSKFAQLKATQIAATIFGLAAVITAVTAGVLAFSIAMTIVSKIDASGFAKSIFSFMMIAGVLIGVPAALMAIYNATSKANLLRFSQKTLNSMTLMILGMGAAVLAMSVGLRLVSASDPLSLGVAIAGISIIFGVLAAVLYNLSRFDNAGLQKAAITMAVMGGVVIALNTMLIILSRNLNTNMIIAGAIMLGEVVILAGAIYGLAWFLTTRGKGLEFTSLVKFAGAMALVAAAIVPISAAMYIVMAAVGGFNMNVGQILASMGGMTAIIIALTGAVWVMLEQLGTTEIKDKNLKAIAITILSMSAALALIAGGIAAVFAAINATEMSNLGAIGVMAAFAGVVVAFGFALRMIVTSLSKVKDAKKLIAPLAVTIAAIVVPMATIAGAVALLSHMPMSGVIAGGAVLFALSGLCTWLASALMDMGRSMKWSNNLIKKILVALATYSTITISMIPLAVALTTVAKQNVGKIWNALAVLTVMGYAITGMSAIVVAIGNRVKDVGKALAGMGSFVGIAVSLCAIALVLDRLRGFKFEEIGDALKALGLVAGAAVAIAVLFGLVPQLAAGAVAAAGLLLGVGVTMAAVGVFLWLSADALDKFIDILLKIDGKTATVSKSLSELLTGFMSAIGNALKQGLIGLSNALSDPEILGAIDKAVTSILEFIRDNVYDWTSLIIQIATAFIRAIVDAIDLYEIGKFLDEKFLGGSISTSIDIIVEANYNIKKASMIGEYYSAYRKQWLEIAEMLGYSQSQFEQLESKYGGAIKDSMAYIMEAYEFGDTAKQKEIEERYGGQVQMVRDLLNSMAELEGITPSVRTPFVKRVEKVNKSLNETISTMSDKANQITATIAAGYLKQAEQAGWGTKEGEALREKARAFLQNEIDRLYNEGAKDRSDNLYAVGQTLGLSLRSGAKSAVEDGGHIGLNAITNDIEEMLRIQESYGEEIYGFYAYLAQRGSDGWNDNRPSIIPNTPLGFDQLNDETFTTLQKIAHDAEEEAKQIIKNPAPSKDRFISGKKDTSILDLLFPSLSHFEGISYDAEYANYKTELDKWLGGMNIFGDTVPTSTKGWSGISNLKQIAQQLKEAGLTVNDIKKMYGPEAAELFAKYFGEAEYTITKGTGALVNSAASAFNKLNITTQNSQSEFSAILSGTDGLATAGGFGKMPYLTLNTDLTKNYFNPLQSGLVLGYQTAGQSGINQFSNTLNTTGQVLGASRPYVESSILSGYLNPLSTFMYSGGISNGQNYKNALLSVLNGGFTVTPRVSVVPEITMAGNTLMEGLSFGASMSNPLTQYINQQLGYDDVYNSPFRASGEMITAGLMYGMQDTKARQTVQQYTKTLSMTVVNYIKKAFDIHSPAQDQELIWASEMVTAGFSQGLTDKESQGYLNDSANSLATSTESAITDSMSGIDMGGIGNGLSLNLSDALNNFDITSIGSKLKSAITSKFPSWGDIKSQFGWEKGIAGNIEGLKNVWGMVKDAFSGGLDLEGILSDAGFDISSFTNGLELDKMGFSISADNIIDMNGIKNEFAGFDVNDFTTNTDLSVKMDLDTSMADEWLQQNSSIDMAASIPVTGGYERSTTGSATYVNNYSFNQSNTSPQALSARDTARYTDLMLRRAGGWRVAR